MDRIDQPTTATSSNALNMNNNNSNNLLSSSPPLLCIKINNVRNCKALNGTSDGALVCVINVEGTDYHPIDLILRRPKSDTGLQKNSFVFQLPQQFTHFEMSFKKKSHKEVDAAASSSSTPSTSSPKLGGQSAPVIAKTNVQLQYSTLPYNVAQMLPRRASHQSFNAGSPSSSPSLSSSGSMPMYVGTVSPAHSGVTGGITIIKRPGGSPSSTAASPNGHGHSGSPQFNVPPYSLSGSPKTERSPRHGSPSMVPINQSTSMSSPALATELEETRIESSLRWYKLNMYENGQPLDLQQQLQHQYHYGHSESELTFTSNEPEVQLKISYENSNVPALVRMKSLHRELLDMVVTSKLQLVNACCSIVDITAAQMMAKSLVDIFHSHHKLLHLLKYFLKKEVDSCHDPNTLFRSNSVAMKMVVAYGHKTGQHYLAQTLTPLVVELCGSQLSFEVDPQRLQPDEDVTSNIQNLKIFAQKFFDRIVQSIDQCPKSIVEICYYFKKIVSRKFPNHWRSAIGGFIFLRLFCPACVSPENANIISPGRVGITERRALVHVAKCLQNLSNLVTFNQPYMEPVNDFIVSNAHILEEFFLQLASRPTEDQTIDGMMVSEESLQEAIVYMQLFLDRNQARVLQTLAENGCQGLYSADRLQSAIDASKRSVLTVNQLALLSKYRSNSAGSNGSARVELKKSRSNSEIKEPPIKWQTTLSKNLRLAKQTVITPTLNVISNIPNGNKEEEVILNTDSEWRDEPRPAHVVAIQLLRNIVNICKNNRLPDQQLNIQPLNWAQVQQSPEFAAFARDVAELQSITFDSMQPDYLAAFFINVFNVLTLHLHFVLGPPNTEVRRKAYSIHKYNIGGNLFSLCDIQHGILRGNPKNSITRTRQIRGGDVRRQFILPLDPRYHFALCAVNVALPCLRILSNERLLEDLHKCGEEFCSSKIDICTKKKEISLPRLFSQYATDFGKSRSEMLKYLFQFLTMAKRNDLLDTMEKPSYLCLYRGESWTPITNKTKLIDFEDEAERELEERKLSEREKILRRKSRSLTHGNKMTPIGAKKDSTASTLINSLKSNALESSNRIVGVLNSVVTSMQDTLDIHYVSSVIEVLKQITKNLSFNEWQKGAASFMGSGGHAHSNDTKPSLTIKAQIQLFSSLQQHCLSPTLLTSYSPVFQELYSLTLSIEKEMSKFLEFMDIASFSQSNDINELLSDAAEQIRELTTGKLKESLANTTEALHLTLIYFSATLGAKTSAMIKSPGTCTPLEEQTLSMVCKELQNYDGIGNNNSNSNNSNKAMLMKRDSELINNKLAELLDHVKQCKTRDQLLSLIPRIERIGKLVYTLEEQTVGRYSPRQSPR
ncbi:hypothetical protein SAMD00019534_006860 [Acytostelium subglobosum LB1]|uniref:hypothetical protein n=1 Tax=Acytostelium subglobosum LB1 TaxID=1410327 RepID=UPI0006450EEC|nr:hypothetical protein SAMD00019534_006860 [Acytostelium subglobosum LB1]GAM17511.1 hypothetical protein SAMD00019534_006860 [Acytostelium subglobosum LB1]|eukprot:XP_012759573.1 hypothetical protein SAMD00019534_006860 [Acytostelium subglobosum LB1]